METHFRPKFGLILAAVLLVLTFCIGAFAQGTGEITGAVTDPTGAVVPNVTVKLTNSATGTVRTTVTSAAGMYRFTALPVVGTYTLSVDAKGFKGMSVREIAVSVGTTLTHDVRLEIGASSEVVNVEGGVQMVQTSESQVSDLINNRVWNQMPLETRNQNEFINLVAGVVPAQFDSSTRGSAVNGTRGGSGNFLVEGMDNNDQGQGGRGQISDSQGGAITGISPEAIQEYRVITNSFSAEYGKAGGFVTDTVLKSGTNQFHGSLFEYNRVQALAANNFFSNRSTDPETGKTLKDFVVRNQFGGSFGGALVKDKTFFYTSVELHRRRDKYPTTAVGVTPEFLNFVKTGAFQQWAESSPDGVCMQYTEETCPGAFSKASTLGPIFQRLMAKGPFPLAQSAYAPDTKDSNGKPAWAGQGDYSYGLAYPVPLYGDTTVRDGYSLNENKVSFKFDHKITNSDQFSASYMFDDGDQFWKYGGGDNTIGPPSYSPGRSQNLGLSWNHTFSPTVLNTFKASYLRHRSDYPVTSGYEGIPSIYTYFDSLTVGLGQSAAMPQFFTDNQFQYQDHISFVKGKHSFKTGIEYRRTRNGSSFEADKNGEFAPYGVEDLVTDGLFGDLSDKVVGWGDGSFYYAIASVDPTTGKPPIYYRGFRANEFAAYFQDDFRVNNRLTLNYGVRWEYFGPPHNFKAGLDSNFYFGTAVTPLNVTTTNPFYPKNSPDAARVYTGSFQQRDNEIWNKDTNNFGPRFGFAYDLLGNQKFVLRGGAGVMYDRIYNNLFENIRFNAPFFSYNNIGIGAGTGVPAGALSTPGLYTDNFTPTNTALFNNPAFAPLPSPRHMDQNLVSPYYEQFHLGAQYEFLKGYVLDTEYVGTLGHKLTGIRDINTYNGRVACPTNSAPYDPAKTVCGAAGFVNGFSTRRISSAMAGDNFRANGFSSNYHSLQMTVKKSFSNGLQFNSNYTWSKALDYLSDAFNARTGLRPTDNWNPRFDYGAADFDIRHRFVTSFSYDLPFMKSNRWLGNWSVNGIVSLQTGSPFSPYDSSAAGDVNKDGYSTDRANYIGGVDLPSAGQLNKAPIAGTTNVFYFDPKGWARATCPASVNNGLFCDAGLGRNSMRGPGFFNTDMGFSKKFKISETSSIQLQGNFFNLFNHTNFALPHFNLNSGNFGQISATANGARVTQLALRYDF
jgi:hypothetical protein